MRSPRFDAAAAPDDAAPVDDGDGSGYGQSPSCTSSRSAAMSCSPLPAPRPAPMSIMSTRGMGGGHSRWSGGSPIWSCCGSTWKGCASIAPTSAVTNRDAYDQRRGSGKALLRRRTLSGGEPTSVDGEGTGRWSLARTAGGSAALVTGLQVGCLRVTGGFGVVVGVLTGRAPVLGADVVAVRCLVLSAPARLSPTPRAASGSMSVDETPERSSSEIGGAAPG